MSLCNEHFTEKKERDGDIEKELESFAAERDAHSIYRLKQTKGTRGRRGSALAEQKYSSVL